MIAMNEGIKMDFKVHRIGKRLCELSVDVAYREGLGPIHSSTGILNADEAKQLALDLTRVIQELLSVEGKK